MNMTELNNLQIEIQDFETLRNRGCIYVDKTDMLYQLVYEETFVFLSRPQRFGKSLLVSTLKAYFEGKKELFEGLKISTLEREWKNYPVISFNFSEEKYNNASDLTRYLSKIVEKYERLYNIASNEKTIEFRFRNLIEEIYNHTEAEVVLLVDEYDKPLLDCPSEYLDELIDIYRAFFGNIKNCPEYIRFGFFTGVT